MCRSSTWQPALQQGDALCIQAVKPTARSPPLPEEAKSVEALQGARNGVLVTTGTFGGEAHEDVFVEG